MVKVELLSCKIASDEDFCQVTLYTIVACEDYSAFPKILIFTYLNWILNLSHRSNISRSS